MRSYNLDQAGARAEITSVGADFDKVRGISSRLGPCMGAPLPDRVYTRGACIFAAGAAQCIVNRPQGDHVAMACAGVACRCTTASSADLASPTDARRRIFLPEALHTAAESPVHASSVIGIGLPPTLL